MIRNLQRKSFSDVLINGRNSYNHIFGARSNYVFNFCAQNENVIVERLGKFNRVITPGFFIAWPIIDRLKYAVDTREININIKPQKTVTQDNVPIEVGGNLFFKFTDPKVTAYAIDDPIYSISQFAISSMRAVVGRHTLDEIFSTRNSINDYILTAMNEVSKEWAVSIKRYEITEIDISEELKVTLLKQAAAERQRREDILKAEAIKNSQILESEGYRQKLINESEGRKIEKINEAEALKQAKMLQAEAEKYEMIKEAEARAELLKIVGDQLKSEDGRRAATLKLADLYIENFGKIVQGSNTVVLSGDIGDIQSNVAKAIMLGKNMLGENSKI